MKAVNAWSFRAICSSSRRKNTRAGFVFCQSRVEGARDFGVNSHEGLLKLGLDAASSRIRAMIKASRAFREHFVRFAGVLVAQTSVALPWPIRLQGQ